MGALAKLKDTRIGIVIGGAFGALIGMVNSIEEDENDDVDVSKVIEEVIRENPEMSEELRKTGEAIEAENKVRESTIEERIKDTSKTFGIELDGKDEEGYNKIPDKLGDIGAEVSETKATEGNNGREKEGRQRTRVDED